MHNLFSYNGTIGRKQYFIKQALLLIAFVAYTIVAIVFSELLSNGSNESAFISWVLLVVFLASVIVSILWFVASLFLAMKRARDTGSFVLWITIAILVPFGYIIVGLIPTAATKTLANNSLTPRTETAFSAPPQPK